MTPSDVRERVQEIRELAGDPEAAHAREDSLHIVLLSAIAAGECQDVEECAREALETVVIDFPRWTA